MLDLREETIFRTFQYEHVPMAIIVLQNQQIVDVNKEFLFITGHDRAELVGHAIMDFAIWLDKEQYKEFLAHLEKDSRVHNFEAHLGTKEGEVRTILWSGITTKDQNNIPYLVLCAADVTELKNAVQVLSEAQKILDRIFVSLNEALFVVELPSRKIILCNPAAGRMFGYTKEELIGSNTEMLHVNHALYKEFARKFDEAMDRNAGVHHTEFQMRRKDGTAFSTEHSVAALYDETGTQYASVSIIHDVTARKEAEKELKARAQSIEDANTTLKVLLQRMEQDRLEMAEKIRSNIKHFVLPSLKNLKKSALTPRQLALVEAITTGLEKITSSFLQGLQAQHHDLTAREIEIANLVKEKHSTKEIAKLLHITAKTVEFHRSRLRQKLGLDRKGNLRSYLLRINNF